MTEQNVLKGLALYFQSPLVDDMRRTLAQYPDINIKDAYSDGQVKSKHWLVEVLFSQSLQHDHTLGTVFVLGGWYGTLSAMLLDWAVRCPEDAPDIGKIRSFDIDPTVERVADVMNRTHLMNDWRFKASTSDMFDLDYNQTRYQVHRSDGSTVDLMDVPNTIINTSCEHIDGKKWYSKIPAGKLCVLQSNNFDEIPEHVDCRSSLQDMVETFPMSDCWFAGELELGNYSRYMLIGTK